MAEDTIATFAGGNGGHRQSGSISGAAILATFIPTFVTAVIYVAIFASIRNYYRKIYAPRTFLGTVQEIDRTPASRPGGRHWFHDFRSLTNRFVLQHNSLDAALYLRFLRFIIYICLLGIALTWPILLPINATGGGSAKQLDKLSFSNVVKNKHIWAHVVVAWVFFLSIIFLLAWERLRLIGIRQAHYLDERYAARLSARTVLFMNVPREACQAENLREYFGEEADRCWPVTDTGDLDALVSRRNETAYALERAELDLLITAAKRSKRYPGMTDGSNGENGRVTVPKAHRPTQRLPPIVGTKVDPIDASRNMVVELAEKIESHRSSPSRNIPGQSAVFVAFTDQSAAHRAFQMVSFQAKVPIEDRFLAVQPKEVLWNNLSMPLPTRLSKASFALAFIIVFTIFFSIPVGILGTISNVKYLADNYSWLHWLLDLPPVVLSLLEGLLPPFIISWFVSYVPKLFRHVAKLSGEPTIPQAELKTQAWYFAFQVFQIFLVTTFSSGAASVVKEIARSPQSAPILLAQSLPTASNFYLTYFILQGTASAASNVLNYSDLFTYLFYEYYWLKTPREKFTTYAQMKGTPWASWYPKFATFLVIAIAYSCIAPLVLGFAAVGVFFYYLSYKYNMLYVIQTKVDTKGEAYKRALQQIPTGIYLAELCLIGLFSLRGAVAQASLMIVLLVLTAILNFLLDRMVRPLELYLGVDIWQQQEVPLLAEEDDIDPNDEQALHGASHARRLGLRVLPNPAPRILSDFFDGIISTARTRTEGWLHNPSVLREDHDAEPLKEEDIAKAYTAPAMTSKTPKLWIPSDKLGISKQEIEANEAVGIPTTDEAAELDEDGKLHWDPDFEHVPIFKKVQQV